MSVAGVEGREPRGTTVAAAPSAVAGPGAPATTAGAGGSGRRGASGGAFHSPELTSGLLSDNVEPWQREDLGRLGRLLGMQPRDVLDALRSGRGIKFLLAARSLAATALQGHFDKGLLIDAQA